MKQILFLTSLFYFFGCQETVGPTLAFYAEYEQEKAMLFPLWACKEGYRGYASSLEIPTSETLKLRADFFHDYLSKFQSLDISTLDEEEFNYRSKTILELKRKIDDFEVEKKHSWDAVAYDLAPHFSYLLSAKKYSKKEVFYFMSKKLDHVPDYYEAVKKNLTNPTARTLADCIKQHRTTFQLLNEEIQNRFEGLHVSAKDRKEFEHRLYLSKLAVKDFVAWCVSRKIELDNLAMDKL